MRKGEAVKETTLMFGCKRCGVLQPITKETERLLDYIDVLHCHNCNFPDRDFKRLKDYSKATREVY